MIELRKKFIFSIIVFKSGEFRYIGPDLFLSYIYSDIGDSDKKKSNVRTYPNTGHCGRWSLTGANTVIGMAYACSGGLAEDVVVSSTG
mgnify:CR=1 FL=1